MDIPAKKLPRLRAQPVVVGEQGRLVALHRDAAGEEVMRKQRTTI